MSELSPSAARVQAAIEAAGLNARVVIHTAPTRTAEEAAAACGCSVAQIVKSLIFQGATSGKPYLLLVSGKNRVNEKAVGAQIGEALKRPGADFVRAITGFAIGGIPPLGHVEPLKTFMDEDLLAFDVIWAAAGTPNAVFPAAPADLRRAAGAAVISVA